MKHRVDGIDEPERVIALQRQTIDALQETVDLLKRAVVTLESVCDEQRREIAILRWLDPLLGLEARRRS